jgi:hypothetical protein
MPTDGIQAAKNILARVSLSTEAGIDRRDEVTYEEGLTILYG